ncbi:DUF336-domain-containing protein [Lentithecium fluviatile CBS 122367]|uniref:DUF336-domain-containing protein n=1 Tax=Lentithecium fluviatile CBS 122367 TaxID=1168545 RepID=A0A6G1J100_9PLEO|nr:DUF336-domain-containing protein [Lentithecium fluviatile CBS 122367]
MATKSVPVLTLNGARTAIAAAEQRAKEIKVPMSKLDFFSSFEELLNQLVIFPFVRSIPTWTIQSKILHYIAVVDSACHLLAFERMEGAKITSINIAIDKAFTAAGHRAPTSIYKEMVWPGGPAFGIWNSNNNRFTTIAGGIPILQDGVVVGAIGCSTGMPSEDEEVAKSGVAAIEKTLAPKAKL